MLSFLVRMHNINENGSSAYIAITKPYRPCYLFEREKIYCAASDISPLSYDNRLAYKTGLKARVKYQLVFLTRRHCSGSSTQAY